MTLSLGGIAAQAATLTEVPPLAGDNGSEVRALTPDGKYAAGISSCSGSCTPAGTRGFFWSSYTLESYRVGNTLSSHTSSTGIGYRTVSGGRQIVVGGNDTSGWVSCFGIADPGANPPPNDWLWRARDANRDAQGLNPRVPSANSIGGTTGENWYFIFDRDRGDATPQNISIARGQGDPNGTMTGTYAVKSNPVETHVQGVSSIGRAVARRRDGSTTPAPMNYRNVYYQYVPTLPLPAPTQVFFKGLKPGTNDGEAWSISWDGSKIGGMAPVPDGRPGQWPYRYDVDTDTIVELPTYPDTGDSDTKALVYGLSADGGFGCGQNYRGQERAVLWDLRDPSPANWKIHDLTAYFGASGQLGPFTRLDRAFSVGVDTETQEVVVSGRGSTPDGTRGFVARIALADFPLPETGACCEIGFCTSRFEQQCATLPDTVWEANKLCANAGCPAACCDPMSGGCSFLSAAACEAVQGNYRGLNTTCETVSCVGACCNNGACTLEGPDGCTTAGGIFQGLGTTCEESTCLGACCLGFGRCEDVAFGACEGNFQGIGTTCATTECPCPQDPFIWADSDLDGDVDMDDFGYFQACYTGMLFGVPDGCRCLDRGTPDQINGTDFLEFAACVTGADVPYDFNNLPEGCTP